MYWADGQKQYVCTHDNTCNAEIKKVNWLTSGQLCPVTVVPEIFHTKLTKTNRNLSMDFHVCPIFCLSDLSIMED